MSLLNRVRNAQRAGASLLACTNGDLDELRDALEHMRDVTCDLCGEPTCLDPSDCGHHSICAECFPGYCIVCQGEVAT